MIVGAIEDQIRDTMRDGTGAISAADRHAVPIHPDRELVVADSRHRSADRAHLETDAALALIVFRRDHLVRHPGARRRRLAKDLRRADHHHASAQLVETFTRTFSLIVRLFGNVMSGVFIIGIILSLAGLLVPIPLMALDLLTGAIQAYIFTVLAMVFIGGAVERRTCGQAAREGNIMNWIEIVSIFAAAMAVSFGAIGPALGEGRAVAAAMDAIARQPEAAGTISRTLFVGLAMIETMAIYCLVIALLVLFANPFVH